MNEMTLSYKTQDSKFEPWRSEAEHATSRSRRLPTILTRRVRSMRRRGEMSPEYKAMPPELICSSDRRAMYSGLR